MIREIQIDKAVYVADDEAKTYKFLRRNPDYLKLIKQENENNKQSINGYTRIFKSGKRKVYIAEEHL